MKKVLTAIALAALLAGIGQAVAAEQGAGSGNDSGDNSGSESTGSESTGGKAKPLMAGGDPQSGKALAQKCAACHGPKGNSPQGQWPNIADQHAGYIYKQLKNFKSGEKRANAQMAGMVAGLSEQDMRDLGAWFSTQPHKTMGAGDEELVKRGREIYLGGIATKDVAACAACHGPRGQGNPGENYPRVGGQWGQYIATQLKYFRSGKRANDPNAVMRKLAGEMTDKEIRAVAEYMAGLH